jgi:hypothetical protein
MTSIRTGDLPPDALLRRYRNIGAYADCYVADLPWPITQAQFVEAFYTTWLFKIERQILAWLVAKPCTDAQANELATDARSEFAAWSVEDRAADQLLLCDFQGRTRSWLMTAPLTIRGQQGTRLYFGSAVVPLVSRRTGQATMGPVFGALLGFHKVYSRLLLRAAASRLGKLRHA